MHIIYMVCTFLNYNNNNNILNLITQFINALALLGLVVDGTTVGIGDSERALTYEEPSK